MKNFRQKFLFHENRLTEALEQRAIWLTKVMNYIGLGATCLAFIVIFFVINDPERSFGVLTTLLICSGLYLLSLGLVRIGYFRIAKLVVTGTGVSCIVIYCLQAGIGSMSHLYLFIPFTGSLLIFTKNEKVQRTMILVVYPAAFLFLEVAFKLGFVEPRFARPLPIVNAALVTFNLSVTMAAVYLILRIYERDHENFSHALSEEKKKTDELILNILPENVANQLRSKNELIAERHDNVSVLFANLGNFTKFSTYISPEKLVSFLNQLFSEFDRISNKHGVEKIKTIGDCYMLVAGLPVACDDHAERAARVALEMIAATERWAKKKCLPLNLRIGIHSGAVVAGVIGTTKIAYDLWGSTVNTASRMESASMPGECTVSEATHKLISERFVLEANEPVLIKSLGKMVTYRLIREAEKPTSAESPAVQRFSEHRGLISGDF